MSQKITPSFWFDMNAEEAMNFYTSLFPNSRIVNADKYPDESLDEHFKGMAGKVINGVFELDGYRFICLDGGPLFKINPSVSFFANCRDRAEVDTLWAKLSAGGNILMPLDKYPFSEYYGWVQDKYGVSWQVTITSDPSAPRIIPALMFTGGAAGKAEEAAAYYAETFDDSSVGFLSRYSAGQEPDVEGTLNYGQLTLAGQQFTVMDSAQPHDYNFNEAVSLTVDCADQAEVDRYWARLSSVPEAEQCGWCKDKYGLAWQIIPQQLGELMRGDDPEGVKRVTQAMMGMHKLDVAGLEAAYKGE